MLGPERTTGGSRAAVEAVVQLAIRVGHLKSQHELLEAPYVPFWRGRRRPEGDVWGARSGRGFGARPLDAYQRSRTGGGLGERQLLIEHRDSPGKQASSWVRNVASSRTRSTIRASPPRANSSARRQGESLSSGGLLLPPERPTAKTIGTVKAVSRTSTSRGAMYMFPPTPRVRALDVASLVRERGPRSRVLAGPGTPLLLREGAWREPSCCCALHLGESDDVAVRI